jgi:hypothetical protein
MLKKFTFYLFVFYCFEVGIFLIVAPWWLPQIWDQNYFLVVSPHLKAIFQNGFFRGAVTGLGILNLFLGISEIIQREKEKQLAQQAK